MIRPLCASVGMQADESILSVVARSAEANVLPSTATLLSHAEINVKRTRELPFKTSVDGKLADLLSLNEAEVSRSLLAALPEEPVPAVDWFGTPLERRFLEITKRRLSLTSLEQAEYHRSSWMLRPLHYCPETLTFLIDSCPSCGKVLGWDRAIGLSICEKCGEKLACPPPTVPAVYADVALRVAGLVSCDSAARIAEVAALPEPFCEWEPGYVFSAIVDLGAVYASRTTDDCTTLWHDLGTGKFVSLGNEGIFCGYRIVAGWPDTYVALVEEIASRNPDRDTLQARLGPLFKYLDPKARQTPLTSLLALTTPATLRELAIPCKLSRKLKGLSEVQRTTISEGDATREFGISKPALDRLAAKNHCLISRHDSARGVHLYDRRELERLCSVLSAATPTSDFAKRLGVPQYVVCTLADAGLVKRIEDPLCEIIAREAIIETEGANSLLERLGSGAPNTMPQDGLDTLRSAMVHQLNPWRWVAGLKAILSGKVASRLVDDSGPLSYRLMVDVPSLRLLISRSSIPDCPPVAIAASVAEPILGLSDVAIACAVRAGLLPDTTLSALARFRDRYVFPAEVRLWFSGSSRKFVSAMLEQGVEPAAKLMTTNLWFRDDVERCFPESAQMELYREWSRRGRN